MRPDWQDIAEGFADFTFSLIVVLLCLALWGIAIYGVYKALQWVFA